MNKELFIKNFINCLLNNERYLSDGFDFYGGKRHEYTLELLNEIATEIYNKTLLNIEIKEDELK